MDTGKSSQPASYRIVTCSSLTDCFEYSLQTIISRNVSPLEYAVISCTVIHTDGAANVIPTNVTISGDVRTYSLELQDMIESKMKEICWHICQMNGIEMEFEYNRAFIPLINSAECVEAVREAASVLS